MSTTDSTASGSTTTDSTATDSTATDSTATDSTATDSTATDSTTTASPATTTGPATTTSPATTVTDSESPFDTAPRPGSHRATPGGPGSTTAHTVILGAGSGGLTVAVGVAARGHRVILVEDGHVGGDCTNVGCVPSKTLIHQAALHGAGSGREVLAEVRRKRDALRERETHEFGELPGVELVTGRGRLLDGRRVQVTGHDGSTSEITARYVVVATGGSPVRIPVQGLPEERILTNEEVFELEDVPEHLVVLGGGVIGMELAFAFRRLGSRVSVVTLADRVMERFEPEVGQVLGRSLQARGIDLHLSSKAGSYDEATGALTLVPASGEGPETVLAGVDRVLMAVGRRRNTADLGLDAAGVETGPGGAILTDSYGRTSVRSVYAVGDVTATAAHTHSANAQGRRAVQRIAFGWLPTFGSEPAYPSATFSEPEVGTAGLTPRQVAERYHPSAVTRIRVDLTSQTDRGYTDDLVDGYLAVDALRLTGRVLGATIVGPRASEMVGQFSVAISGKVSLHQLFRVVQAYPTWSSGVQKVADTFVAETLPYLPRELGAYLRYRWAKPRPAA